MLQYDATSMLVYIIYLSEKKLREYLEKAARAEKNIRPELKRTFFFLFSNKLRSKSKMFLLCITHNVKTTINTKTLNQPRERSFPKAKKKSNQLSRTHRLPTLFSFRTSKFEKESIDLKILTYLYK